MHVNLILGITIVVVILCLFMGEGNSTPDRKYGRIRYGQYKEPLPLTALLEVVYSWKELEYSFPTPQIEQDFTGKDSFKPSIQIPIDVQPHYTGIFSTFYFFFHLILIWLSPCF